MYPYSLGLVQRCGNSIVNALELPQSCAKPSKSGQTDKTADITISLKT